MSQALLYMYLINNKAYQRVDCVLAHNYKVWDVPSFTVHVLIIRHILELTVYWHIIIRSGMPQALQYMYLINNKAYLRVDCVLAHNYKVWDVPSFTVHVFN